MAESARAGSRASIVRQLRGLGVRTGGVLLVHSSFRAVRPVEGGPLGLVDALRDALGPAGTLVMPAWGGDDDAPFDPVETPVAEDLGVVAATFAGLACVWRSGHAHAFAAAGPLASRITADPPTLPPHGPASPVGRVRELDGQVLLLGVGHEASTTLRLAELLAGVPYRVRRHVTVLRDGGPARVDFAEPGHCCAGFTLADGWLRARGLQAEGPVGNARARLARAADVVTVALEQLSRDPLVFLHRRSAGCAACDEARASCTGTASLAAEGP